MGNQVRYIIPIDCTKTESVVVPFDEEFDYDLPGC